MFDRKIDGLFQGLPNVFYIVHDILIAGCNDMGRDHDATLNKILRICRQAYLKPMKDKCLFQCRSLPFFWEVL